MAIVLKWPSSLKEEPYVIHTDNEDLLLFFVQHRLVARVSHLGRHISWVTTHPLPPDGWDFRYYYMPNERQVRAMVHVEPDQELYIHNGLPVIPIGSSIEAFACTSSGVDRVVTTCNGVETCVWLSCKVKPFARIGTTESIVQAAVSRHEHLFTVVLLGCKGRLFLLQRQLPLGGRWSRTILSTLDAGLYGAYLSAARLHVSASQRLVLLPCQGDGDTRIYVRIPFYDFDLSRELKNVPLPPIRNNKVLELQQQFEIGLIDVEAVRRRLDEMQCAHYFRRITGQ